jgi:hypothetical protein
VTYVVDKQTYFPLLYSFAASAQLPASNIDRYLKFEILAPSAESKHLLDPVADPQPYLP